MQQLAYYLIFDKVTLFVKPMHKQHINITNERIAKQRAKNTKQQYFTALNISTLQSRNFSY